MRIEELNSFNEKDWTCFLEGKDSSTIFFTLEWKKFIEEVFHLKPLYYLFKAMNQTLAVFPSFLIKSIIFGNRIISLPFSDYGGVYFSQNLDAEKRSNIINLLLLELEKLVVEYRVDYIELRGQSYKGVEIPANNFQLKFPYVRFKLELGNSLDEVYSQFSHSIKYWLRRTAGSIKVCRSSERSDIEKVYDIYARDIKKFGSPPLPKQYLYRQWDIFKPQGMFELFLAYKGRGIIGAETFLIYNRKVHGELVISDKEMVRFYPKGNLFFESIKWAHGKEYSLYDFGRTRRNTGVYEHKRRWTSKKEDIPYIFFIYNDKSDLSLDAAQKKFVLAQKFLRLMPVSMLKAIGPFLRVNLGK